MRLIWMQVIASVQIEFITSTKMGEFAKVRYCKAKPHAWRSMSSELIWSAYVFSNTRCCLWVDSVAREQGNPLRCCITAFSSRCILRRMEIRRIFFDCSAYPILPDLNEIWMSSKPKLHWKPYRRELEKCITGLMNCGAGHALLNEQ